MNVAPRIQQYCCPACGNFIGEAAPIESVRASITAPAHRLIFDMLARSPGQPVMRDAIMDRMYGGRIDGGPDRGDRVLQSQMTQLRRKIEAFGWTIPISRGGSGNLAQWRLIPTESRR